MDTIKNNCNMQYIKNKVFFYFALYSFVLLFIVSPDSYLHDICTHTDSAWFFMCGKAWMNGLLPYADFADSKGPLLWLIYGVGYLISNTDFTGVFWISWIFYTFTFYFICLTAHIFIGSRIQSALVTVIVSFFLFLPFLHYEIRAEDFAMLFISLSLYRICRLLYGTNVKSEDVALTSFILGFCFASTLLIKYNIAAMTLVFFAFLFVFIYHQHFSFLRNLFISFLGFCTMAMPFIVYFIVHGNLSDFINEYFINAYLTVRNVAQAGVSLFGAIYIIMVVITMTGALMIRRSLTVHRYFPIVCCLWFSVFLIKSNYYYVSLLSLLTIFGAIAIEKKGFIKTYNVRRLLYSSVSSILLLVLMSVAYQWKKNNISDFIFTDTTFRRIYYSQAYILSQVSHPKVIYWDCTDRGQSVPVDGQPACRYWSSQWGSTPSMLSGQRAAVYSRTADFVFIESHNIKAYRELNSIGYDKCNFHQPDCPNTHILFSKHKSLRMPPEDFHIRIMDLLLKRRLFVG